MTFKYVYILPDLIADASFSLTYDFDNFITLTTWLRIAC
jgi:hypothetical protein